MIQSPIYQTFTLSADGYRAMLSFIATIWTLRERTIVDRNPSDLLVEDAEYHVWCDKTGIVDREMGGVA